MKTLVPPGSLNMICLRRAFFPAPFAVMAALAVTSPMALAGTSTTTTMTLTLEGSSVTSVDLHTAVTLTATVKAGATTLKLGQVKFCDADTSCQDIHLKGIAQITAAGTATLKLVAGPGSHSYTAVFAGTTNDASSESMRVILDVASRSNTLMFPSKTVLSATGSAGSYTLSATVAGLGAGPLNSPTGAVYFLDRSDSNYKLGKARLPAGSSDLGWTRSVFHKTSQPTQAEAAKSTMVTGDFNGDGHVDLAVLDAANSTLDVLLGDGQGHLKTASVISYPKESYSGFGSGIAAGDFNNDGKMDLAVSISNYALNILLGNGDGSFQPAKVNDLRGAVKGAADFNHDGNVDLVVSHADAGLYILSGNGDSTFKAEKIGTAFDFSHYSIGDFDGDGNADVEQYYFGGDGDTFVSGVQYGNGDGTFTANFETVFDGNDPGPAQADLNEDGRTDLVFSPYNGTSLVLLGNKDRTFKQVTLTSEPNTSDSNFYARVVAGDFNGDGIVDAAFAFDSANQAIDVALGKGDATFVNASTVPYGANFPNPAIQVEADFNEDGVSDLAALANQGATEPGYGVLLTQSTSTVQLSGLPPKGSGSHEIVARYISDNSYTESVSKPLALTGLETAAPVATLSSLALSFGAQAVGEPSHGQTVVLTNSGTAALTINSIKVASVSGPGLSFATSNNCPATLAEHASCMIRLRFNPGSAGSKMSQIVIADNAANSPQLIKLTGTGVSDPK